MPFSDKPVSEQRLADPLIIHPFPLLVFDAILNTATIEM